jgi:TolA-binding protein
MSSTHTRLTAARPSGSPKRVALTHALIGALIGASPLSGCVSHYRAQEMETRISVLESKLEDFNEQRKATSTKHEAMFEHMDRELKRFNDEVIKALDNLRRGSADDSVTIGSLRELVQSLQGELSEVRFKLEQAKATPVSEEEASALPADKNELYQLATERLTQKDLRGALVAFEEFVRRYPTDIRADDSLYGMAEAYYAQTRYEEVERVVEQVLREHADAGQAEKSLMLLHDAYLGMDKCPKARDALRLLVAKYPRSNQARAAQRKLPQLEKRCP